MKRNALTLTFIALLLISLMSIVNASSAYSSTPSSPPGMEWEVLPQKGIWCSVAHVIQTNDSGYLMAGTLGSRYAPSVVRLVKVNSNGKMQWNQTLDYLLNVVGLVRTWDGGYMIAGDSYVAKEGLMGVIDRKGIVLVKIDYYGNIEWNRTLPGPVGGSSCMIQTKDAGYIIAGNIEGDQVTFENTILPTNRGFLIKIDDWGNLQWFRTYGNLESYNYFSAVIQNSEGGYAVAGSTNFNGTTSIFEHFWLLKVDSRGNVLLTNTYGAGPMWKSGGDSEGRDMYSSGGTEANCIVQTVDNCFVLAGNAHTYGAGDWDVWLVKTGSSGNIIWNRTYGGSGISTVSTSRRQHVLGSNGNLSDIVNSLIQTSDGGFAFAGTTPTRPNHEGYGKFAWLVKLDSSGNVQWNQTFPDIPYEDGPKYGYINYPHLDWTPNSLIETSDGGFALAGKCYEGDSRSYYYLVKTQQALPPPSPTPIPTPPSSISSNFDEVTVIAIATIVVAIAFTGLLVYFKKRKH